MNHRTWMAATALFLALAVSALSAEPGKRDFDRGFFLGVEGWDVEAANTSTDFAVNEEAGGELIEADHGMDWSYRYWLGYAGSDKVGTFRLSYWSADLEASGDDANASDAGIFSTIRRDIGEFGRATADSNIDLEVWDFTWTHRIGQNRGRKFSSWWSAGVRYFEYDQSLRSDFTTLADAASVDATSDSDGLGIRMGVGGRYMFGKHFGLRGEAYLAYLMGSTETWAGAPTLPWERYDESDKNFLQFDGDLGFAVYAGAVEIGVGYRWSDWQDVITLPTKGGQEENVTFSGPYVSLNFRFGQAWVDTDGDTVRDSDDQCPDTPSGCFVNEVGCPSDSDNDGVCDGRDKCPGTPFGAKVDANGCPTDSDGDTVADGLDVCPGTPFGCRVDMRGCEIDSDNDGVCDGLDACPGTPRGMKVDDRGCPVGVIDSDGDTVPDDRDRCPNTPRGVVVDEFGCERVLVLENVLFDFNKATIKPDFYDLLNKVAGELKADAGLRLELRGHTDAIGSESYNAKLGQRRADAVREYLVARGVDAARLTTRSFGESMPVAPNTNPDGSDNPEGRQKNRRTEFQRTR